MLEIRQENKKDCAEVYNVIKKAFMSAEHCDGNEQDLVVNLRESNNFIPELSLVAIDDNKIVGYILFTKIRIGIKAPFEVPNENFMAIELNNTDVEITGVVEYAKEFGI